MLLCPNDTPSADLLRRKRDHNRDGHGDRTDEAVVIDRRVHEQQVRETAETERQHAQVTIHGLSEAAQAEINRARRFGFIAKAAVSR